MESPQRSDEWSADRLGRLTASRISDALAKGRNGSPSASRSNYMAQLVAERLTGVSQGPDLSKSQAVQFGIENEESARLAYEFETGNEVTETGFIPHPRIDMSGASPDGLIGDDGLLEIKCPNSATHISYLLDNKVPSKYVPQIKWQLACSGRQWCDFVSYDPRLDMSNRILIVRYEPKKEEIEEIEAQAIEFLNETEALMERLRCR